MRVPPRTEGVGRRPLATRSPRSRAVSTPTISARAVRLGFVLLVFLAMRYHEGVLRSFHSAGSRSLCTAGWRRGRELWGSLLSGAIPMAVWARAGGGPPMSRGVLILARLHFAGNLARTIIV